MKTKDCYVPAWSEVWDHNHKCIERKQHTPNTHTEHTQRRFKKCMRERPRADRRATAFPVCARVLLAAPERAALDRWAHSNVCPGLVPKHDSSQQHLQNSHNIGTSSTSISDVSVHVIIRPIVTIIDKSIGISATLKWVGQKYWYSLKMEKNWPLAYVWVKHIEHSGPREVLRIVWDLEMQNCTISAVNFRARAKCSCGHSAFKALWTVVNLPRCERKRKTDLRCQQKKCTNSRRRLQLTFLILTISL